VTTALLAAVMLAGAGGTAAQLYKEKCQGCHLPEGNAPVPAMNFTDGNWIHGRRPAEVAKVIAEGLPEKGMIAYKHQLTRAQIEALARFVLAFDKTTGSTRKAEAAR
jgi:mono/diheme cytochrome c family protein